MGSLNFGNPGSPDMETLTYLKLFLLCHSYGCAQLQKLCASRHVYVTPISWCNLCMIALCYSQADCNTRDWYQCMVSRSLGPSSAIRLIYSLAWAKLATQDYTMDKRSDDPDTLLTTEAPASNYDQPHFILQTTYQYRYLFVTLFAE